MVTCWERADLSALVAGVYCIFASFPCGILGHVWYLIVSFLDLVRLSSFSLSSLCILFIRKLKQNKRVKSDKPEFRILWHILSLGDQDFPNYSYP